jgi:ankyrin repeat protein
MNSDYNEHAWSRLVIYPQDDPFTLSHGGSFSFESASDESMSLVPSFSILDGPKRAQKPFATKILAHRSMDSNSEFQSIKELSQLEMHAFVSNLPKRNLSDLSDTMEQLLGPPTIEAALRYVELGIYMCSNNLRWWGGIDSLSKWMIKTIPWPSLRPMFSVKLRALEAFAERFLATAAELANITIVRDLIENSGLVHLVEHVQSSGNVLRQAVQTDNVELVVLILNAGADPEGGHKGSLKKSRHYPHPTPLSLVKSVRIAQILIDAGADPNSIGLLFDLGGYHGPAIINASWRGCIPMVRYLIGVGADVNLLGKSSNRSFSALSIAVNRGQAEMVELLLKGGANINVPCTSFRSPGLVSGLTLLQGAAMKGTVRVLEILLQYGSDVNAPPQGKNGITALQAAIQACRVDVVRLLLEQGADVNAPATSDMARPMTVLHTAVESDQIELVNILLEANADVNANSFGEYGSSILESAKSRPASSGIIEILLANGALNTATDPALSSQIDLHNAVRRGDLDEVKRLCELGVEINMEIIPERFRPGAHVSYTGTVLHSAMLKWQNTRSNIELLQFLVDRVVDINIHNNHPTLRPILHTAIKNADMEAISILLGAGVDVNTYYRTVTGGFRRCETPMTLAADCRDSNLISLLLSKGAGINSYIDDYQYTTVLQSALRRVNSSSGLDFVKCLLVNGALLNAEVANGGKSELAMAVYWNDLSLVQLLLDHGADVNYTPKRRGKTALQAAAGLSPPNAAILHLLLSKGALVNAPAAVKYGVTALQAAAVAGSFEIARGLLNAGADVNAMGSFWGSRTALEAVISFGRLDMVYLLLEAGSHLYVYGSSKKQDVKAADFARSEGHIAIAEMIEEWAILHGK